MGLIFFSASDGLTKAIANTRTNTANTNDLMMLLFIKFSSFRWLSTKNFCYSKKKESPPFRATTIHIQNEKAELTSDLSLGSSAIFSKIRRFPSPPHGRFGFIGRIVTLY
jgi:hypothetical protein